MTYNISLPLPSGWVSEQDRYEEVENAVITHLECHYSDGTGKVDNRLMDIYVGDMPSDTTAEDEAYANYIDIIGFDGDDDEEGSTIAEWRFRGKKAYGFSGECEDGSIMLLMCVELIKGCLVICSIVAGDDDELGKLAKYIEDNLKISKA